MATFLASLTVLARLARMASAALSAMLRVQDGSQESSPCPHCGRSGRKTRFRDAHAHHCPRKRLEGDNAGVATHGEVPPEAES